MLILTNSIPWFEKLWKSCEKFEKETWQKTHFLLLCFIFYVPLLTLQVNVARMLICQKPFQLNRWAWKLTHIETVETLEERKFIPCQNLQVLEWRMKLLQDVLYMSCERFLQVWIWNYWVWIWKAYRTINLQEKHKPCRILRDLARRIHLRTR